MHSRQYYLTHDCPHCGAKDAPDEWGGARMSSSAWGHSFSCCSDDCGFALAKSVIPDRKKRPGGSDSKHCGKNWLDKPNIGFQASRTPVTHGGRFANNQRHDSLSLTARSSL
jgi:hypothetical protein